MPSSVRLLKASRLIHLYLGVFAAPALLFFAFTGAVQTFSLHETTRGSDYKPPAILVKLAQLHKKQTVILPVRKPQPPPAEKSTTPHEDKPRALEATPAFTQPAPAPKAAPDAAPPAKPKNLLPMKIFFLIISVSLLISTITGIYMAYRYTRNKTLVTAVLFAGIILPLLLLLI